MSPTDGSTADGDVYPTDPTVLAAQMAAATARIRAQAFPVLTDVSASATGSPAPSLRDDLTPP